LNKVYKALQKRILVLDGAMGTMLQAYKFTEEDFVEVSLLPLQKIVNKIKTSDGCRKK
jgi:methionine synthase I (cobalamin-dependent)